MTSLRNSKRFVEAFVDDLAPSLPADETVRYSFSGVSYEIDLSAKNAAETRKDMERWVAASRRVGGRKNQTTASSSRSESTKIRAWAKENGVAVSEKGKVPQSVVQQYEAAQES